MSSSTPPSKTSKSEETEILEGVVERIIFHNPENGYTVARVVPDGTALKEARSIADAIAANGPLAVQAILRSLRETEGLRETEALDKEFEIGLPVFNSKDAKEGPRAFKEKRTPNFIGE